MSSLGVQCQWDWECKLKQTNKQPVLRMASESKTTKRSYFTNLQNWTRKILRNLEEGPKMEICLTPESPKLIRHLSLLWWHGCCENTAPTTGVLSPWQGLPPEQTSATRMLIVQKHSKATTGKKLKQKQTGRRKESFCYLLLPTVSPEDP